MILYRFCLNIGRPETTYGLTRQHLLIGRGTTVEERIPLSDIVRVTLKWHGKFLLIEDHERFQCVIRTRRKTIKLSNVHYRGLRNTEARNPDYRRFVLSLHKLLAGSGNQVRFDAGQPVQRMVGTAGMILIPLMFALSVFVWVTRGLPSIGHLMPLFLLACCYAYAVKSWRMGARKSYDPAHPPLEYLPAREDDEPQSKPSAVAGPDDRRVAPVGTNQSSPAHQTARGRPINDDARQLTCPPGWHRLEQPVCAAQEAVRVRPINTTPVWPLS